MAHQLRKEEHSMARAHTTLRYAAATLLTVAGGVGLAQAQGTPGSTTSAVTAPSGQQLETTYLVSRLHGADVYNLGEGRKIADVEDIVVSERGQIVALILSHGGAGAGERHVAVNPAYFRLRPMSPTEVRVETNLTAEQLRSVPPFDYPRRQR
jgi:sporulation protein YlmC with PRC-barrel domain